MNYVIDTNVAVVANGKHEDASDECVIRCIDALLGAQRGRVLLDDQYLIFNEYKRHLSYAGQPGVGDAFFKWLWSNQANQAHCKQVAIVGRDEGWRCFEEFPDDPELEQFDRSDQKFVAVALASQDDPEVLNASDNDWWIFRPSLERHGIRLQFLCPELMGAP